MSPLPPGEPRESPKPEPIGNIPLIILFTTCTMCVLFLLWRKADTLKKVVSHQLKSLTRPGGRIRLSEDDGPPAREFLEDDYDEDNEGLDSTVNEPADHLQNVVGHEVWQSDDIAQADNSRHPPKPTDATV